MKAGLLLSALLVLSLTCVSPAQLSGSYTIDPAGSGSRNYTTWAAAVSALGAGVSGPVVFTVASTTFNGAVTLNPVKGATATATVTFQAAGAPAILDAGAAQDGLILAGACTYLIFDNIEVKNVSRYALSLSGPSSARATFCTFKNCKFDAPATSSTTVRAADFEYSNDCTFENCVFAGGGYGTYWQQINRCTFKACEFDGKSMSAYLIAPFNSNDADNLFENCFFHDCGPTGRGLYFDWSSYGNLFFHNTIIMKTSNEAVRMCSCCAWSRCMVWRNNIIVNMGTGWAAIYGFNGTVLDYNDLDNNCYFAPNATGGTLKDERGTFSGTLAQWKTYFAANPTIIPAGGGTNWDQNSIEADPQLVSMTAPYDIHLKAGSPCLDAGTTTYIAGSWVSYNASYVTATDFEGEARPTTNVDIGADEVSVRLVGSGSGKPGTAITLNLYAPADPGLPYQLGSSLGNGPIPIDTRFLYLSPDPLLVASVNGYLPTIFVNYSGFLDTSGQAVAALAIPNVPALTGIRIYTAFVTIKAGAPSNLQSISGTFLFTVM